MLQLRRRDRLSGGDFGWLKARHHFKVTPQGDPAHGPLGALIVWNDDEIAPGAGFDLHGHRDMEIISYVREGAVTHQDTIGSLGRTEAGDVQVMSAGTGIRHAEYNRGEVPLKLFQIWLLPRTGGGAPNWSSRQFPKADRAGRLLTLASEDPHDADALPIRADARVLGATLMRGDTVSYDLAEGRYAYLVPARGVVTVNGARLETGDGLAAISEGRLDIRADDEAEIVLVDAGPAPAA
ncbi:MAG TPA: pirin family protein [Caulobacteraceae bacterium]|nr:pirin family protein [Caulobacteraceae bacterium]